ncbi:translin-like [Ylistrum balloti]|uniref:translin-like n=1 Tax=Ylistrum balloti TaxID=509963 RepID=UPI002905E11A|nr:translin-like [Ylistrum balloti]
MASDSSMTTVFADFQKYLNDEQEIREQIRVLVRDIEQTTREIHTQLQLVHQHGGIKQVQEFCEKAEASFETLREQYRKLAEAVPPGQYYRFHDHWKFSMQRCCFLSAFITYLQTEKLVTREETAAKLGVQVSRDNGFHMDLDDFLIGVLQVASELSRLAVNAVTASDYSRPLRIAKFVAELDAGYRLLNLKNDALRKRFDGLKYDLKKVEEIVYDLTIRGLKASEDPPKE